VIGLASVEKFPDNCNVWLEVGIQSKNTQRYISLNQLHNELGNKLCRSLPGYHAFTGCDYTASFSKRGKTRPFNVLRKHERFQEVFYTLGIVNEVAESFFGNISKEVQQ